MKTRFAIAVLTLSLLATGCQKEYTHVQNLGMELKSGATLGPAFFARNPSNPILSGSAGSWDNRIGNGSAIKAGETYYLFYYGAKADGESSQIGVATTRYPFGPWGKNPNNPVLQPGARGEWDDFSVRNPKVIKAGDSYAMFYDGRGENSTWRIGLAQAPRPEGPWSKYRGNPIAGGNVGENLRLGAVFRTDDKYVISFSVSSKNNPSQATYLVWDAAVNPEGPWLPRWSFVSDNFDKGDPRTGQLRHFILQDFTQIYLAGQFDVFATGFYEGYPLGPSLHYFRSQDRFFWTPRFHMLPIFVGSEAKAWDQAVAEPALLVDADSVFLFYLGSSGGNQSGRHIGISIGKFE